MGRTATRRHTIGAVDAIWLHMDRPENLLVIDTLMWLDGPLDVARLRDVLQRRLVDRFPVFGRRPAEPVLPFGTPRWEDDPDLDLDRHVVVTRLPAPGGDRELRAYVEARIAEPLDRDHPLWQVHVVQGHRPPGTARRGPARTAVLARIHHAVADGIALAQVLLSLTDPVGAPAVPDAATDTATDIVTDGPAAAPDDDAGSAPAPALLRLTAAAARSARDGLHLFADLPRLARPGTALDALALAWQVGRVADKLLLGSLPSSPLSGTPGRAKLAVWSQPHDLGAVKAAGRATGSTVNDILMTALGGAVAEYLRAHGSPGEDLTAMVPVNVRGPGAVLPSELGNRFALVLFPLAGGRVDVRTRLALTRARMDEIKASPEAAITFGVLGAIGRTHPEVERVLVDFFSAKAIGVLTNVVGPAQPRTLAGVPLSGVLGWVPQAGAQTVGMCVFSYAGTVRVGFRVDAAAVPDPELLVAGFEATLADLEALGAERTG
ncbi:MAG: wax ester/triacylglycerol synthase family O-acyltransferase [Kineosporiaceae bacterium]